MIVKMHKTYVAARKADENSLLDALRTLGVIHLMPVDPKTAVAHERTLTETDHLARAVQLLGAMTPAGEAPAMSPLAAAEEALAIERQLAEQRARLVALHRTLEKQAMWDDVRLSDIQALSQAGLNVSFYSVAPADIGEIKARFVCPLAGASGKRQIVAAVTCENESDLPESVEAIDLPDQDNPAIRAEAADIDAQMKQGARRLAQLANLVDQMETARTQLQSDAEYTIAQRGAVADDDIFAVQGWVPAERSEKLAGELAQTGIEAAVETTEPGDDDAPPTLIRYSRLVKPIKALFDILGTLPGYDELDLSPFFMLALPLFAAMLIGDAGYGLVFALPALLMYRKLSAKVGSAGTNLLLVMGLATMAWGVLTANYFGITPSDIAYAAGVDDVSKLADADGFWGSCGRLMLAGGVLWRSDAEAARTIIIKISFIIGCVHLTLAHLRQFVAFLPGQKALAELGWCIVLWAMLGIIWLLFFQTTPVPVNVMLIALASGAGLAILFGAPSPSIFRRIGVGMASAILPLLGTFSDTMSYIRLMAVGLASYYIASAFNNLGASLAKTITWYSVLPVLIVVFGHLLNIGLAVIAIFAHGVRLNMLEFSNNAGVQWAGQAYDPFCEQKQKS